MSKASFSQTRLRELLQIFVTLQPMKELPRQGFIYFGFKRNESDSVAAHSFQVIAISFILARELLESVPGLQLDLEKVLTMALIHDFGEAITGDIGYAVKLIAQEGFNDVEEFAFDNLTKELSRSETLRILLDEFNECGTTEAKLVRFADGLDAWMQVLNSASTWMPANEEYNRRTCARIADDKQLGNSLAQLYREMSEILRTKEIGPKWPQGNSLPDLDVLLSDEENPQ